jgi:hypothetical protein
VDEFLQFIPKRTQQEWKINPEGLVEIKVQKFKSNLGKSLCKTIRKDQKFSAKMDELGSLVWQQCDGKKTVKQILTKVKKQFPKEENIDQRLFLFLQQLHSLNYITM